MDIQAFIDEHELSSYSFRSLAGANVAVVRNGVRGEARSTQSEEEAAAGAIKALEEAEKVAAERAKDEEPVEPQVVNPDAEAQIQVASGPGADQAANDSDPDVKAVEAPVAPEPRKRSR